jgi:beta-fructofuranosidase
VTAAPEPGELDEAGLRASADAAIANRPAEVDTDPWRQSFHIQPPVGLLNDPNGLVQHDGTYHLCFQWHPFAPGHGLKYWAHLTGTDLVHWTWQPPALVPSDPIDRNGCYSGSGIVHDGAARFLYTGNVRGDAGERWPHQNLATLQPDGTVAKHPANPVVAPLDGYTGHVRDPKVWFDGGSAWMVLGAQTLALHGTVLLLRSADLLQWHLVGEIAGGDAAPHGYMWECPDLVRLDGRDVLVISPQFDNGPQARELQYTDETVYAVGALDLGTGRFAGGPWHRMDAGPDFYAPQTFVDEQGRTILLAWLGMPDHPGQPDIAVKHPTVANGWVHCLTVPRSLTLDGEQLVQLPVPELAVLRGEQVPVALRVPQGGSSAVPGLAGQALDLELRVACGPGASIGVRLRDGAAGRPAVLRVDPTAGTAELDRSMLGTGEGGVHVGHFRPSPQVDVRVLLDHSSLEVFIDGGRLAMSARIYPQAGDDGVTVEAVGGDVQVDGTGWPMGGA